MQKLHALSVCSVHRMSGVKNLVGALNAVKGLKTLNLPGRSLRHSGAVALGGMLSCLSNLKHLDMSFCNIDCLFTGREKRHKGRPEFNGRWEVLDNRSQDGGVDLAAGLSSLSMLEVLVLRDSARVAVNTARAVSGVLPNLRKLRRLDMHGWELSDVVHDTDEVAESLRFCGSGRLEQLDLSSTCLLYTSPSPRD